MRRLSPILVAVLLVAAACGDEGGMRGATTTTTQPPTTVVATQTCTAEADGYRVEFPQDWFTNETEVAEPCRFFHPEPFELEPATEATEIAIVIRFTSAGFDELTRKTLEDPGGAVIREQERLTIAGQEALRIEAESTGEALLPEGTRSVQYFVDFGRTMTAVTLEVAQAVSFERSTEVLDRMMRSLQRVEAPGQTATCSASDMSPEPEEQPGLPRPVAEMRAAVVEAAVACDFGRLEELALAGTRPFTYSFGAEGDPGGFWLRQEQSERGPEPLRFLVGLLDRPHRLVEHEHEGDAEYVWPSAFGYDSWDAVPEEAKEALKPLYTEEDFEGFERFGGYVGYRIGITPEGDWIFFVAGD